MLDSVPQKPDWPWRAMSSGTANFTLALAAAFLAVAFSNWKDINWGLAAVGGALALVSSVLLKDVLDAVSGYYSQRRLYENDTAERKQFVLKVKSKCQQAIVDWELIGLAERAVRPVDIALQVRSHLLTMTHPQFVLDPEPGIENKLRDLVSKMYVISPYDLSDVCSFVEKLMSDQATATDQSRFAHRISWWAGFIAATLHEWNVANVSMTQASVEACKLLISKHVDLPLRDDIVNRMESMLGFKVESTTANFVDHQGKLT